MRRIFVLFLTFFSLIASAQSLRKTDDGGNFLYEYRRVFLAVDSLPNTVVVSFSFINGPGRQAISYRQERVNQPVKWMKTDGAHFRGESVVDALTANLAPGDSVCWTFAVEKVTPKMKSVTIEQAALLLMDEQKTVEKIYFDEKRWER